MEALRWFLDPIKNHYFDFDGRASREQYWMFFLSIVLISLALSLLGSEMIVNLFSLAVLLPNLAISVRRLHDIGKSGLWLLIILIPIIGFIVLLVFHVRAGQRGTNQYGPDPLAPDETIPMPTPAIVTEAEPTPPQAGGQG